MKILFVSGFGPIVKNNKASQKFYMKDFNINFEGVDGDYIHTEKLKGVKHFALWPLSQAAESCFGKSEWPSEIPIPQAWVEFDVEDVHEATMELKKQGYQILVEASKEPWGQIVTRLLSPEGILTGVVYTPWMRNSN